MVKLESKVVNVKVELSDPGLAKSETSWGSSKWANTWSEKFKVTCAGCDKVLNVEKNIILCYFNNYTGINIIVQ